ncbi:MAG: proline dehydrogenase family protein [Elusimicrobia bacterium]|nr:proline dehydrogenase family protein [Elusimicrobiota bacterium]
MKALTFLARRFVAGDTISEAVSAVLALNREGIKCTLDNLGEECRSREQAEAARDEYLLMLRRLAEAEADCNVSLKLTQFGLSLDEGLARDNLMTVAEAAKRLGNFVRIDMEGSPYTQKTLDIFYSLQGEFPNTGVVIQAYLRRSERDVEELVRRRAKVRLCKGAYKEPPEIAFATKEEVNASYDRLASLLVKAPLPAFATHDDERIEKAAAAAEKAGLKKSEYEIQMLYGLRAKRWRKLVSAGHAVRVYIPYGTHWFPYFYRRLRERKENLMFVVKNLFN